jgi:hypothetical protein
MQEPQYYQYQYSLNGTAFVATANGDLTGDGVLSTFSLGGELKTSSGGKQVVVIAPNIGEVDGEE